MLGMFTVGVDVLSISKQQAMIDKWDKYALSRGTLLHSVRSAAIRYIGVGSHLS